MPFVIFAAVHCRLWRDPVPLATEVVRTLMFSDRPFVLQVTREVAERLSGPASMRDPGSDSVVPLAEEMPGA